MSGQDVAPTYPFPITYVPGGGIHPHLDVSDNELSLTFQVGIEDADVWPIAFLDPRGQDLSNLDASGAKWADPDVERATAGSPSIGAPGCVAHTTVERVARDLPSTRQPRADGAFFALAPPALPRAALQICGGRLRRLSQSK